jgi:preprotein translocase subunit SecB
VISVGEDDNTPQAGYELQFTLLGVFVAEDEIQPEALGGFARTYTLSILWPYAREYTADQLRRAGQPFDALPIINPQVVTEKLVEADLVEIKIISPEP